MKSILNTAAALVITFALASCAAHAESPNEALPGVPPVAAKPSVAVPEDAPVAYKEISGVWIGKDTGSIGDFHIRNVRVAGGNFTANFFFQSPARSACDVSQPIQGTYVNEVMEFYLTSAVCGRWEHRGKLSTFDWKGGYTSGRFSGWYVVKKVDDVDKTP